MKLTRKYPRNFDEMAQAMLQTEQTKGQTVYQHGQSVLSYFYDLLYHLQEDHDLEFEWRLPKFLTDYKCCILSNLRDEGKIHAYLLYHDCGKPYCCHVDKKLGTVRFPDHAEVSKYIWACVGGNDIVGQLIGWDMVIHTASAEEITRFCEEEWDVEDGCTLLLASLAEVHSNARMFGGIESNSFKSKWKKIERRGKQICKHYFGKEEK